MKSSNHDSSKGIRLAFLSRSVKLGLAITLNSSSNVYWLGLSIELKGIELRTILDWLGLSTELEGLGLSTATTD